MPSAAGRFSGERGAIARGRDTALLRIERWIERHWLIEATAGCDEAFLRARALSEKHTERLGCRSFDLLHVALALELQCDTFLTADRVQGALARTEGLEAAISADAS